MAQQLVKGLGCAPVFFALISGQFKCNNRDGQLQRLRQTTRVVLNQLGGAGGAHQHGVRFETCVGMGHGVFEQLCGVAAQVTCLEGGVGDRRAFVAALDHGEQQVGVGVALRCMQHVVHVLHGRGDAHRTNVGWAFVCPERELHVVPQATSLSRRIRGRLNKPAKSPACS